MIKSMRYCQQLARCCFPAYVGVTGVYIVWFSAVLFGRFALLYSISRVEVRGKSDTNSETSIFAFQLSSRVRKHQPVRLYTSILPLSDRCRAKWWLDKALLNPIPKRKQMRCKRNIESRQPEKIWSVPFLQRQKCHRSIRGCFWNKPSELQDLMRTCSCRGVSNITWKNRISKDIFGIWEK